MNTKIMAAVIALCVASTACTAERPGVKVPQAEKVLPHAELLMGETEPGWVFCLRMENLLEGDEIRIETDMVHMQTFFRMTGDAKEWKRFFPTDTLNSGKKGSFIVSVKRDGQTMFRKKLDTGFADREFSSQELRISQELLDRRIDAVSDGRDKLRLTLAKSGRSPEFYWGQPFVMPVDGRLSTPFGARRTLNGGHGYIHSGIDLANRIGTSVKAANSGVVVLAESLGLTGNTVVIDHGRGLFTTYAHLESMSLKEGDWACRGQEIGKMGSTGFSTGSHLHFETELLGVYIDPFIMVEKGIELKRQMEGDEKR